MEPVAATQHTAAGAKAFAEFFIKTIDWGYATTSSAYMRHYFETWCSECDVTARFLDNARRMGDHYIGSRIEIQSSQVTSYSSTSAIDLRMLITSVEVVDANGKAKSAEPAYPNYREHVTLTWKPTGWRVSEMAGHK